MKGFVDDIDERTEENSDFPPCAVHGRATAAGADVTPTRRRKVITGEWLLILNGALSLAFGAVTRATSR